MNEPTVSVIIPTYNRLGLVEQAIDSALGQTFRDLEIIVVDDGSSDGTGAALERKYRDQIIYRRQENQGESAARNHGISIAKGKYIAFLDSDDIWCPEKLAIQVSTLEDPHHEGAVVAYSSAWMIDENGDTIQSGPIGRWKTGQRLELNDLTEGPRMYGPPSNMLIRTRELREAGGFDPSIQFGEDWDLVIRLRSKGRFVFIDQPLYYYRVHRNSQQGIPKTEDLSAYLEDTLKIIQKNEQLIFQGNKTRFLEAQARIYRKVAAWCFVRESWDLGIAYAVHSFELLKNRSSLYDLAARIGYWESQVLLEGTGTPEAAEDYLLQTFLPAMKKVWLANWGSFPAGKITGAFYHNLAFRLDKKEKKAIRALCLKSISNDLRYLISPNTIKTILWSYM